MKARAAWIPLFLGIVLLASCERPAIKPTESLVGAKKLPSATALAGEIIQVNLGFGDWGRSDPGRLYYELWPDNTLTITLQRHDWEADRTVVDGTQRFQLSPERASQVRRSLWRVRPEELKGVEWDTEIADCPPPTDDFPDYAVVFIAEGPRHAMKTKKLELSHFATDELAIHAKPKKPGRSSRTSSSHFRPQSSPPNVSGA